MSRQKHWQQVYASKDETAVSWFQALPQVSLQMIHHTGLEAAARIVDVGGGASRLVDHLLDRGFQHLSVLDIAPGSLEHAKNRLGPRADVVEYEELGLGAEESGIGDAGRFQIGFGALGDRTRVSFIAFTCCRLNDIAADNDLGFFRKRIHHGGSWVRH